MGRETMERDLSVRALEKLVKERQAARSGPPEGQGGKAVKRPLIKELEQTFAQVLGMRVEIFESRRKGKGKVVIHYKGLEDFDRLCEHLDIAPDGK